MNLQSNTLNLSAALVLAGLLSGCATMPGSKAADSSSEAKPASTAAATPANPATSKVPPGMNNRGEVIDSKKVEAGHGQKVKGIGNWEGEITGKPAPGSKFTALQIGMGAKQATDIAGQPTDQGAYVTGKAFIPFYFGADRHRFEMTYKGMGRLIFAGSGGLDSSSNLIWIIHNANETGYR